MKNENAKIVLLPLEKILPNRFQPRIKFSEDSILELADSIKEHGVLQPIIVRTLGDKYEIVAGERRYKASVIAGIKEIPSILYDMNDKESAEVALIENVQRKDLSPIEQAISFKKILDMGYLTQSELASKIGVSQSALANKIRLLNLCDDVQEALLDEKISERHARSLLKITNSDDQASMLKRVISKKLTVRALDDEINYYIENNKFKETPAGSIKSETIASPVIEVKAESDKINNNTDFNVVPENNEKNSDIFEKKLEADEKPEVLLESKSLLDEKDDNQKKIDIAKENNEKNSDISEIKLEADEKTEVPIENKSLLDEKDDNQQKTDIIEETNNKNVDLPEIKLEKKEMINHIEESSLSNNEKDIIQNLDYANSIEDNKEAKKEDGENSDIMNNSYDDINYNTLKNNNLEHGKFLLTPDEQISKEDNSTIFNFSSEEKKEKSDIFKDLMAPQGSKNLFSSESNESIINTTNEQTDTNTSSMFPSLMNVSNEEKNEEVDNETINKFLDPAFIDGTKQTILSNNNDNSTNVFSKFINDVEETNNDIKTENENFVNNSTINNTSLNDTSNVPNLLAPEIPTSMVYKSENSTINNSEVKNDDDGESSGGAVNVISAMPSIFGSSNNNDLSNNNISIGQSNNSSEINSTSINFNNTSSIFSNSNEQKPDLLAPMSEPSNTNSVPNVFSMTQQPVNAVFDEEKNDITSLVKEENTNEDEGFSLSSLNDMNEPNEPTPTEQIDNKNNSVIFNQSSPIFITASSNSDSTFMPSTPIIDNTVNEETQNTEKNIIENNEESVLENITPNEEISNESSTTDNVEENNIIGNQPIIITDYNKQYDPVLPNVSPTPEKVDFKKILNLIRELSETIEKCGYEIDTDEIDLQDKYQVIFNINK